MKDYFRQTMHVAGLTILICGFSSCGKHNVVPHVQPEERSPAVVLDFNYQSGQGSLHVWNDSQGAMEYVRCHCFDTDEGM